ncbi:DinB family protein [Microbacterium sp. bgisy189]|uniref:DinB family protein n=1 Tax=Microbacterium sp. bgisy189 TaxID=3413798 RepID=UPI003EBDCFF6
MTDFSALLTARLRAANGLYLDLIDVLTPDLLTARLPGVRSAPIWNQFWCVVGARESYVRWSRAGAWQGFACSLERIEEPGEIRSALARSMDEATAWLRGLAPDDEAGWGIAVHLLEHETQHHGQLIRYLYGVPLPMPQSWIDAYALDT